MSIFPVLQISPNFSPFLSSLGPLREPTLSPLMRPWSPARRCTAEKPGALSHFVPRALLVYTFTFKIFAFRGHCLLRADVRGGQLTPLCCFQRARSASPCPLCSSIPGSSVKSSDLTTCQPEGDLAERVGRGPEKRQGPVPACGYPASQPRVIGSSPEPWWLLSVLDSCLPYTLKLPIPVGYPHSSMPLGPQGSPGWGRPEVPWLSLCPYLSSLLY